MAAEKSRSDTFARDLVRDDGGEEVNSGVPGPSTNPATNLLIADIVVRGASRLLRDNVEQRVAKASYGDDERAREVLDGRTLLTSLGLYAVSRLATRSKTGLMVVTGGLLAKTLYDRGKAVSHRRRGEKRDRD
ncbi:MAG: hypothetical protein ACX930_09720 [Erythrobacter sp.]